MTPEARPNRWPAILVAAALHVGLFVLAVYFWPKEPARPLTVSSVPVQIVSDAPATAPTIAPDAPAEAPVTPAEEVVEAVEPPPPPPPTPTPTPPEPRPTPLKKLTPAPTPTKAKPTPPKPAPAKRNAPAFDPSSIADSLSDAKARRPARPNPPRAETKAGGAPQQGPLSSTGKVALDALIRRLNETWLPDCSASGVDEIKPRIRFRIDGEGRLSSGPTVLDRQPGGVFTAAADRAVRAVRAGEPYDNLPVELLNQDITITFNGERACRGR